MTKETDREQKSHWAAIAAELGLPTDLEEPAREHEQEPEPAVEHADDTAAHDEAEPWHRHPAAEDEAVAEEPLPAETEDPIGRGERDIVIDDRERAGDERDEGPRRGRRRGRRGKRGGEREEHDRGSHDRGRGHGRHEAPQGRGRPHGAGHGDQPEEMKPARRDDGGEEERPGEGEAPGGERGGRRRRRGRGRGRDRDRGQHAERAADMEQASVGPAQEEGTGESGWESIEDRADGNLEDRDAAEEMMAVSAELEERAEAGERDEEPLESETDEDVVAEHGPETEEDDYDIMDDEDPYADWNIPSWQELIASLYRPER